MCSPVTADSPRPTMVRHLKDLRACFHAINMNTGHYLWTVPANTSAGPIVTESGLLFLSGGGRLNAYDARTGKLLWEGALPSAGITPITYMVDGRQYVAVETGGRRGGAPWRSWRSRIP
jgi:glucose dehydrogenase